MRINPMKCFFIFSILVCSYNISVAQNLKLIDQPAPQFELFSYCGEGFNLEEAKGKVIVIDFWATWCAPCIKAFPAMIEAEKSFSADNDVIFLYVNTLDVKGKTPDDVFSFLQKRDLYIDFYDDENGDVAENFGVTSLPVKIVIDKSGVIRYIDAGFAGDNYQLIARLTSNIKLLK